MSSRPLSVLLATTDEVDSITGCAYRFCILTIEIDPRLWLCTRRPFSTHSDQIRQVSVEMNLGRIDQVAQWTMNYVLSSFAF